MIYDTVSNEVSGYTTDEKKANDFLVWLTIELAATICGSKPSTILSFMDIRDRDLLTMWKKCGSGIVQSTLVQFISLRSTANKETILFYRPDILAQCITKTRHRYFLKKLGYPIDQGVDACLAFLKERFQYSCPHEIGVLLGIPLKDVLGFMDMTKLPQTCRKEWCIYGNPTKSLAIIQQFADDRSLVSCLLAQGMTPYGIMCGTSQATRMA